MFASATLHYVHRIALYYTPHTALHSNDTYRVECHTFRNPLRIYHYLVQSLLLCARCNTWIYCHMITVQ
jgi:hypothetical protein